MIRIEGSIYTPINLLGRAFLKFYVVEFFVTIAKSFGTESFMALA